MVSVRMATSYPLENTRGQRVEERRNKARGQSNADMFNIISDPAFGQLSS